MSGARGVGARGSQVLPAETLAELRAALVSGASPSAALVAAVGADAAQAGGAGMARVVRQLRAGHAVAEIAGAVDTGDPAADLLVRALAVAERTGSGSLLAVDQAVSAARDEADLARLLRSRTLQARGTAVVLTAVPVCAWVLLVAADRSAVGFYGTPPGAASGGLAVALAAAGQWWARRLVAAAERAGHRADPLVAPRPPVDRRRAAAAAVPALVVGGIAAGPLAGLLAAALVAAVAGRRTRPAAQEARGRTQGGAAETVELVAVALAAGLPPSAAVAAIAPFAQPAARAPLADAARRLRNGWDVKAAFAGGGLAELGATLAVTERWGAPAGPALRGLADELRAVRRAAVEEAAERTQLTLVFPTTLLTLPAFLLGVVPPLLWTAFAG